MAIAGALTFAFATARGLDPANLSHVPNGKRRPSQAMLAKPGKVVMSATVVGGGSGQRAKGRLR